LEVQALVALLASHQLVVLLQGREGKEDIRLLVLILRVEEVAGVVLGRLG
jgi:hypothetical protein